MWKGYYGKEPFNLRLTVLRMLRQLPVIVSVTILGALVFGGGYYLKNVVMRGERSYVATSVYRVEYAVDNVEDMMDVYINEMSWNTYMQSDMFLDAVQGHLAQDGGMAISSGELGGMIAAVVRSDLRIPSTIVTADSPEKSVRVSRAVEAAMTGELPEEISELASVVVIDAGDSAVEVLPDVKVGRAFVFSGAFACFCVLTVLLLKETGDDSIWLPASIWKRYGVRAAGTVESIGLAENIRYFFRCEDSDEEGLWRHVALCPVQEQLDSEKVLTRLKETLPDVAEADWFAVQSPMRQPEVCRQLREAAGILLVVKAGSHAGRILEQVLDYLEQQGCHVTAAILWEADEGLIRRYGWHRT